MYCNIIRPTPRFLLSDVVPDKILHKRRKGNGVIYFYLYEIDELKNKNSKRKLVRARVRVRVRLGHENDEIDRKIKSSRGICVILSTSFECEKKLGNVGELVERCGGNRLNRRLLKNKEKERRVEEEVSAVNQRDKFNAYIKN